MLAVELYEGLVWSPVAVRIEQILGLLGQVVFVEDHLSIARTLLEKSADELLPGALAARFRTVMTQACANLLTEYALNFSLEDVIALDDDLHEHGNDASLAGRSSIEAFDSITSYIEDDESFSNVEELDEFEGLLISQLSKRGLDTRIAVREIDSRRERLFERGRVSDRGDYSPSRRRADPVETDHEIRSMFANFPK